MVGSIALNLSETAKPLQLTAINERFPELGNVRDTFGGVNDIFNGVDLLADNKFYASSTAFQLKCRQKADNDICLPIKIILGKEKAALAYSYVDENGSVPFILNFKSADYIVVSLSPQSPPQIFSTASIVRAFLRHGTFTEEEVSIKKSFNTIDTSEHLLFISPRLLFQMLLYDFLYVTCGAGGIQHLLENPNSLGKSVIDYDDKINAKKTLI